MQIRLFLIGLFPRYACLSSEIPAVISIVPNTLQGLDMLFNQTVNASRSAKDRPSLIGSCCKDRRAQRVVSREDSSIA